MKYFSVFLVIKDENEYLREWLTYHRLIGVDHFYIYDNDSKIPVSQTLSKEVLEGLVSVVTFPGEYPQMKAFSDGLTRFGSETFWMAFIDTDEFLMSAKDEDFKDVLKRYEEFGGLALHWRMFGSSGHATKPDGLQIESFTMRATFTYDDCKFIKWIIQPSRFSKFTDPHNARFKPGSYGVDEKKTFIRGGKPKHTSEELWINHYFYRSRQEWEEKVKRRSVYSPKAERTVPMFDINEKLCNAVRDESIFRFLPRLKKELGMECL